MSEIKDSILELSHDIEDAITEAEDSDEITDEDIRAEVIDALEDALSYVLDAIGAL